LVEVDEPAGVFQCFASGVAHAGEEVGDPAVPVTCGADVEEMAVIVVAVSLKIRGKVEQRLRKQAGVAEIKGDEKPTDATVAVKKRVDGLELIVEEGDFDEMGLGGVTMQVAFPLAEERVNLVGGWRHVSGGVQRGAGTSDPVLGAAEFAGGFRGFPAAHRLEENGVSFLDEAGGDGNLTEPGQAGLQGTDMVGDLDDGGTRGLFIRVHLEEEEFIDFGIGVLDE